MLVVLQHTRFFQGERLSGLLKATKGKVELSAQEITGIFLFEGLTEPLKGIFSCVRERTYDLQGADWGLQGEQGPGSPGHMQGGRVEPVLLPATC